MTFKRLSASFSASPQLSAADVAAAADAGFRTIIDSRPDAEDADQPSAEDMEAIAQSHGLDFAHIPVTTAIGIDESDIAQMRAAISKSPGPVLGYCRTGTRAAMMWALSQVGETSPEMLMKASADAGFDLSAIKSRLVA
ncbi:TIGR01244 family phosphatase [Lichenicola cladoniae]|uniref:TIGR01244 family phosphatase n=1 Tax=Lichenicola cladoniae TaxID=1484109 RepID=A0A6M8HLR4_9PROT|nr:TIGR01244 family sulfur transferase [Lichenicola cladoniae]NPD70080.1 TIGR01244 family phosphatase [Acetobacteraceae bacterium]QKE89281.1 TIGR01244 family phosphatase [Lichenicola cladoniae]